MFMGKDGENRTECRKVQCPNCFVEQSREKVDNVLVGRGFLQSPQQIKLRQYLVPEGTRHLEGQMADK